METLSNVLLFVCWFTYRNSVSSSQNAHVNSGFWEPTIKYGYCVKHAPLLECPLQHHSGWHVKSPPCSSALPIFLHTPMCWGLHCFQLFWDAREPRFSLYAFQRSTWYERIQNFADLLLRSMVIFSPTRDGHESGSRNVGIHIGRRARSPSRMFARVCAQSCDVVIGDKT